MSISPPRIEPLSRFGLALASAALALSACTSTGASNTTIETTRVIVTPPSTSASDLDPTTSTTTLEDVEAAVRQVHTRFMTELFNRDERVDGPEVILALAEELTTGRVLARTREAVAEAVESGERIVSRGFDSNIVRITLEGDTATVLDCSLEQGELYSASGELLTSTPGNFEFIETWLVREGDIWLVEEFVSGGDIPCVPPLS